MSKIKKFIANGLVLTGTSLFLRWIGVLFNTYISNKLGSEGMGVYSLVQSVFNFAVTFACSGINLGTTRLVSEALANERYAEIKKSIKKCICYSLVFSITAFVVVYFGAEYIGGKILGDIRTIKSVRILAFALPFISLSSVFNGYFSAVRRVYKSASVMVVEQFVQIGITVRILSLFTAKGVEYACVAVAVGTLLAEIFSLIYNMLLWYIDIRKHRLPSDEVNPHLTKKLLGISIPLALSAYARSGLVTLEHLLIPYGLRKNGASYSSSMSTYGLVHGMVFPIIMFPSCIIYSFSGLLVPELAGYNELKAYKRIDRAVTKVLKYALIFSIGVSGILICFAYELSTVLYKSAEAYEYIRLFAPLVSVMYLDGAVDGILKGLNEQLHSMKINIADAFLSVLLVYFLVPSFGIKGYIIAIFVCEIFNCSMSLTRLVKICRPDFSVLKFVFKPLACIMISTTLVVFLFDYLGITFLSSVINLSSRIICTVLCYLLLVFGTEKKAFSKKVAV